MEKNLQNSCTTFSTISESENVLEINFTLPHFQLNGCIVWNAHTKQYSTQSTQLSVHKLFTSCIRRGLVSRDSIVGNNRLPATEWC